MCGVNLLAAGANVGMQALGSIHAHNAERDATNRWNQSVALNAQRAGIGASNQYADQGRSFVYEARSAQQEAQQAVMAGRAAQGTGLASAGSSGFTGSSLTVGGVMAEEARRIAENEQSFGLKMEDLRSAYKSQGKKAQAEAQDNINKVSYQSGPSGTALGLNIANSVAEAGYKTLKNSYVP